ncbi:phytanoyl-dioxygenase family protein [Colletotrichum asianum]
MVQRLSRDASLESFIGAIERDGCVVVKDFANLSSIKAANAEVQSYLDAALAQSGSTVGALNGGTATCTKLIGRSQTSLADHFIGLETEIWYGDEQKVQRSDPLLSISITMSSQPGCKAQKLHRDDKNHHAKHVKADEYSKGRDMLLGLFVPGCDTTEANGATRIVPGSHLWGDEKPDFGPDGTKGVENAELRVGEAFIMLGSLYHGAGEYSLSNGCRTVHIMFMCSGVHRQEEIPFLSYPIEEVKTYSKLVQDRLGWKQSEPNLGWVDLKSPEFLLEQ